MPRTPPSGADAELIRALAERNVTVTVSQLERWRTAGLLPRHPRSGLGRGRGSRAELLPATITQAEVLARTSRQGRAPASLLTSALMRSIRDSSPDALRAAITGALRGLAAGLTAGNGGPVLDAALSGDEADDARAEALLANARRRSDLCQS